MNKVLVFDMDGTIADLYGVENWLSDLRAHNPRPFRVAKPIYDMATLNTLVNILKENGWTIAVTSWLPMESNRAFDNKVRVEKMTWLKAYGFPYDEVHLVKYGTTKAKCTRKLGGYQVLIDDNEQIRKGWNLGGTINANNDLISELVYLISCGE